MNRYRRVVSILFLACLTFFVLIGVSPVSAQTPPQPIVAVDCPHVLKPGIPFAWLRFNPSSTAGFSITMRPGDTVQPNNPATLSWDGFQWWIFVWYNPLGHGYYWVELNSLQPQCQSITPTPVTGAAPWTAGTTVQVRGTVPFVWFRTDPAPGAQPIYTVLPGTRLTIGASAVLDQFQQWWWHVRDPRTGVTGWVEQGSLELASAPPTTTPQMWRVGDVVRVRGGVPFSWLRNMPNSLGGVNFTAGTHQQLTILSLPQFDGVQNWWRVGVPFTPFAGWVEEGSLEFVRRG